MRVTFHRPVDHERAAVLIERDDHVVYRLNGGPITSALPHDLVHYTVEDSLGMADGIWGAIAGGAVYRSMTHVSGRRPPHAAERSAALIRRYRDRLMAAELLGGFVEAAAAEPDAELPRLRASWFASRPSQAPGLGELERAVEALRGTAREWRAIPVGGTLELRWPSHRRIDAPLPRQSRLSAPTRRR